MATLAFCEISPYCRRNLKHHWPHVPIYDDVRSVSLATWKGNKRPNVICGGFPCQDLSLAGKGEGLAGRRSGLWWEYHRIIKEFEPAWVIIENVPALRSRGMDQVLRSLSQIGYDSEWNCLPACAIGAPHQRDRIWIVAYPSNVRRGARWEGRLTDRLAWLQDTPRWNPANTNSKRLSKRKSIWTDTRSELETFERSCVVDVWQSKWPDEPALCGVDDGLHGGVDLGLVALGNSLVSGIAEIHGRAIIDFALHN